MATKRLKSTRNTSRAPTDIDKVVGENVRKLRRERNLTLAELGDALRISHQQLQKYETGVNRLSAGMLYNVAGVLQVPIEELFAFKEPDQRRKPTELARRRKECHAWINRAQSTETLKSMAKVLKALVSDS